jgi:hypothetical protein
MADNFQQAVERRLKPAPAETAYGFPVLQDIPAELDKYFRANRHVAGMVWGRGANESPSDEPYSIAINPYSSLMKDPAKRDGVLLIEAARIHMRDDPVPAFEITPAMQAWREKTFKKNEPYYTDDKAFRETLVSRVIANDLDPDLVTPEVQQAADKYWQKTQAAGGRSPVRGPQPER